MYAFVYGTLTDPARVESVREDTPSTAYAVEGPATLEGLHRIDGRYPTLAPGGSVDGRLLAGDRTALDCLDRYEGVDDGLYVPVAVSHVDRDSDVFVYVRDPVRLAVAERVDWPEDGPFLGRVRRVLREDEIVVQSHE
ncbi:gamma-glutamylcyclotransferase family protein [Natronobacterium gregoryi]|uniref:AIG2 family protein n=2 Tax=Natronobacterium gregoryi TaxID=44930 RepID=L0AJ44_NATGS|nr:gamma-glutamylcyclotransferase family protein [Natronobacterium gregoryi]AFZ73923.1 AIG2-like family protein [Natronobacterium gregoryi SP2]ELY71555.1 AIG2 family protein [Natronobacterium gregoryi SP2]PLK19064.1 gamma-glutamylcyclotransferase [Natronobacterium gregoryi SP2]SFJ63266.1 Gamma-glutamyl cyclotransferase, AIG2-like [Natronobacterium gregoryi]